MELVLYFVPPSRHSSNNSLVLLTRFWCAIQALLRQSQRQLIHSPPVHRLSMCFELMKSIGVVYPSIRRRSGGSTPPPTHFNLEEKSMKKVCALLIFVGLCTAVFLS